MSLTKPLSEQRVAELNDLFAEVDASAAIEGLKPSADELAIRERVFSGELALEQARAVFLTGVRGTMKGTP
jgi:hypothetical protein